MQSCPQSLIPEGVMKLEAPGMPPLRVPLREPKGQKEIMEVKVWSFTGQGVDMGEEAADWFSEYLCRAVRLVRFTGTRPTDPSYAEGCRTAFSDGFPMLLTSEESLGDLNARLDPKVPMSRFRPNIVLSGCGKWGEDRLQTLDVDTQQVTRTYSTERPPQPPAPAPPLPLRILQGILRVALAVLRATPLVFLPVGLGSQQLSQAGIVTLLLVKPCSRCKMTTTNQETGEVGNEPLSTLVKFRSGARLGWKPDKWSQEVFFGW
eukprot:CAMPEP_0196581332 /NCGR_PEP_ID=MMETSP1081-20130531/33664_1 /TAXON_ID=36882 /ORGANISM="Pyramimonas amylifera, Strain CCMP720" /LENGTH=261 /DNA_ID=CAMNT_0041901531 /DNA_START=330 /DNA_END=1112 /DNA_ORIENTATION=+